MRNTYTFNSFIIILLLVLVSCDKESNKDDTDPGNRDPRLKKLTATLRLTNNPPEEINEVFFRYNNKNELVSIASPFFGDSVYFTYLTDGKIISSFYQESDDFQYTTQYTWDKNTVTKTSTSDPAARIVITLDDNENMVKMESYEYDGTNWQLTNYNTNTWINENLTRTEIFVDAYSKAFTPEAGTEFEGTNHSGSLFYKYEDVVYTYDQKENPFRKFYFYKFSENAYMCSANNAISVTTKRININGELINTFTQSFIFTYLETDLPETKLEERPNLSYFQEFEYE